MTLSDPSGADSQDDSSNLFRILISSDIHLGYAEKDPERGVDSFNSFDELLGIGEKEEVDMVLLGGDLFHENKPTRQAEIKCVQILRNHVLGDRPIQMEYLSDPSVDYAHCNSKMVNYESGNLNIGLPVFSIHGNHDDPSGFGATSCLDLIHETGFVNYFGKVTDLKHIKVRPILLRKGGVKLAIYGLSHVKDERLHRLLRENKVEFQRPEEDADSWFHLLVLHQNRAKRGPTSYIPESFLPSFFHLVIWGHEHDCRIWPENCDMPFLISQPGSPVATSLCEGESIQKHVGILNIRPDNKFKMDAIPLRSVRPLIFKTICVTDLNKERVDLKDQNLKRLAENIERELQYEVEEMISEADTKMTGHPLQGKLPLIRLRVEYTDESQQLNSARFGNKFYEKVANPSDVLLFKKRAKIKDDMSDDKFDANGFGDLIDNEGQVTMEDLIQEYFGTQEKDNKLSVLDQREFGNAVKIFIDKDDKDALKYSVDRTLEGQFSSLMEREDGLEVAMSWRHGGGDDMDVEEEKPEVNVRKTTGGASRTKAPVSASVHAISDDDLSLDEDEPPPAKPARGRGRGRGSRGGRGRAAPAVTSSPAKRGGRGVLTASSRDSLSLGSRAGSTQSTLAQSFARAAPRHTSTQARSQRNKKQQFESDSDE